MGKYACVPVKPAQDIPRFAHRDDCGFRQRGGEFLRAVFARGDWDLLMAGGQKRAVVQPHRPDTSELERGPPRSSCLQ
jgi:hypothetical protein